MNNKDLKAAVEKYQEDYKSDPDTAKQIIETDLNEADAKQVIAELSKPTEKTPTVSGTSVKNPDGSYTITEPNGEVTTIPAPQKQPLVNQPGMIATAMDSITQKQANHKNYKWFDEFDVRIQKVEVRNVLAGRNETIITGWELQKKKHPKFIEPHLAVTTNAFANGYDILGVGPYLVPRDTMKTGDVIPYLTWATEQGKNLAEDLNILLQPK
jgi:hypothetical protein